MVTFVPGLAAPATTPRWALLAAVVPAVAIFTPCRRFTVAHGLGALLLGWAALSLFWTPNGWDGLRIIAELAIFAALFHIGAALPSLRPVYIGAALGLSVSSLLAVMQVLGLELVDRIPGPTGQAAGLFMNRNYLAEPAALVLIGLIGHRLWWALPLVLPSVLPVAVMMPWNYGESVRDLLALPMSRGAVLGLLAAGMLWLWPRSRAAVVSLCIAASAALFLLMGPSTSSRFVIWASTLDGMTWLGNGIGSFYTLFPSHAPAWDFLGTTRPVHAHNDWLEFAYELGPLAGICLLGTLIMLAAMRGPEPERFILIALITEAAFGFPWHFAATVFLGGLVAGQLCVAGSALCGVFDRGRAALRAGSRRVAAYLDSRPQRSHRRFGLSAGSSPPEGIG